VTRRNSSALIERREHGAEAHVDPDVDLAELALDLLGRGFELVVVGHVGGDRVRGAARRGNFLGGLLQALGAAGDQPDAVTALAEQAGCGAADSGAGAVDDDSRRHAHAATPRRCRQTGT